MPEGSWPKFCSKNSMKFHIRLARPQGGGQAWFALPAVATAAEYASPPTRQGRLERIARPRKAAAAGFLLMALAFAVAGEEAKKGEEKAVVSGANSAVPQVTGQEAEKASAGADKDWTRQGPILEPPAEIVHRKGAGGQIEFGEIAALVGEVAIMRPLGHKIEKLQQPVVGEKIFVEDQLEVGKASAAEIVMGMNGRLRLGGETILKILDQWEMSDSAVIATQRNLQIERGMARVRLRRNEHRPVPALVVAGKAVLLLGRGDAVIQRDAAGGRIMVLNGEAEVVWRPEGGDGRADRVRLRKRQQLVLSDMRAELPAAMEMSEAELAKAEESLRFSIDEERVRLPPAPKLDLEMEGL